MFSITEYAQLKLETCQKNYETSMGRKDQVHDV